MLLWSFPVVYKQGTIAYWIQFHGLDNRERSKGLEENMDWTCMRHESLEDAADSKENRSFDARLQREDGL